MDNVTKVMNQNPVLYLIVFILSIILLFTIGKLCGSILAQIAFYLKS